MRGLTKRTLQVNWMMGKTWGQAPESLEQLHSLHDAFKNTKIGELLGL